MLGGMIDKREPLNIPARTEVEIISGDDPNRPMLFNATLRGSTKLRLKSLLHDRLVTAIHEDPSRFANRRS